LTAAANLPPVSATLAAHFSPVNKIQKISAYLHLTLKFYIKNPTHKLKLLPLIMEHKQDMKKTPVEIVFLFSTVVVDTDRAP
jgi:hypothetical protein